MALYNILGYGCVQLRTHSPVSPALKLANEFCGTERKGTVSTRPEGEAAACFDWH